MTSRMRQKLVRLLFLIDERAMCEIPCPKRCISVKPISPEIREAADDVYKALADEPGPSRAELLEVK